ncbi:MAG: LysM peptidoglycan-binding domain-containing protein [Hyphomicrobiales bacterium]
MPKNPLAIIVGAAAAGAVAVGAVTYNQWGRWNAPVEEAAKTEAPKAASTADTPPATPPSTTANDQKTAAVEPQATAPAIAPAPQPAPPALATPEPPSFDIVRVEPDGSALVAGRAAPGADVVILVDGKNQGTAKASERGEWVWTSPIPLAPGNYQVTLEASLPSDTQKKTSEQAVAVVVPERDKGTPLVVLSAPDQPSKVIQKPEATAAAQPQQQTAAAEPATTTPPAAVPAAPPPATQPAQKPAEAPAKALPGPVTLETVDYNDSGDIIFAGKGNPGATVRLYVDNQFTGDAAVAADGTWTWSGQGAIKPGQHALRADEIGKDAKVASRVELPFVRAEPKQVAAAKAEEPAQPQAAPSSGTQVATAPSAAPAEPAAATPGRIVIQPGNNLWNISRVLYGKGTQYTVIYEANKDLIRNPSMIYPGQVFTTPGTSAPSVIDPKWRKPLSEVMGQQPAGQAQN